ncbi:hypothetical protein [Microbacterium luticocti]|uniref:hypothetical protein n=1 Tax=Microbacterium luticocti TaxID=451764 RepID=UPI00048B6FE1|nr:hypothetical protein [Microbacterium luticocti]
MDATARDELARLRARAYGPDADIADDPEALRRLRELEAQSVPDRPHNAEPPPPPPRDAGPPPTLPYDAEPAPIVPHDAEPRPTSPHDAEAQPTSPHDAEAQPTSRHDAEPRPTSPHDDAPDADAAATTSAGVAGAADGEESAGHAASTTTWRRHRIAWAWAASLVAAVALAGGLGFLGGSLSHHGPGRQIDSVLPDPDFDWSKIGFGTEKDAGYHYRGMTIAHARTDVGDGNNDAECLIAVPTSNLTGGSGMGAGPIYYGCGAGPFGPTVQFTVTALLPAPLRQVVPRGHAVQFALDGDELVVLTDAP